MSFSTSPTQLTVITVVVATVLCSTISCAETEPLVRTLARTPNQSRLKITLIDTQQYQGQFVRLTSDSLTLQTGDTHADQYAYSLDQITSVQRWQSDLGRTTRYGAVGGAIVLGSLGLLAGLSLADTYSDTPSGVAVLVTGIGVGLGAVAGGILGLGTGLVSRNWYTLWPRQISPEQPVVLSYSQNTQLSLVAGIGHSSLENYTVDRFAGRVAFLHRANSIVRLGPEFSFVDFGGTRTVEDGNGNVQTNSVNSIFRGAISLEFSQPGSGLLPYFNLGLGGTASNDLIFSGHVGGGLRKHRASGIEFDVDLRFHFSISDVSAGVVGSYWTAGIGFGFGI